MLSDLNDAKSGAGVDPEAAAVGSCVTAGTVRVKSPEGAGIGLATVADKAGVADFVAEVDAVLEALVSSV